jgi:3-oxoacyl-[acyl-carrier-protein] synthase II
MRSVITGWGVISPLGTGAENFAAGIREGRSDVISTAGLDTRLGFPCDEAYGVANFDVAKILGTRKGTRVLDRTAALAVAAATMAIRASGVQDQPGFQERIGVVLGTCNGSTSRLVEFLTETMTQAQPEQVSPEAFPNTVMNFAAGQCAIWNKLKAVNTTVSGGRMAGILALRYARRMLQFGYAEGILVGSVEELSAPLAWATHTLCAARGQKDPRLGEGCAIFMLENADAVERSGRRSRAEVLACEAGFDAPAPGELLSASLGQTLGGCIRRALAHASLTPADIWAVSSRASGMTSLDEAEAQGLALALADHRPSQTIAIGQKIGECFSASGSLQLASLLAVFENAGAPAGKVGLVTSMSHGGGVGAALVRNL